MIRSYRSVVRIIEASVLFHQALRYCADMQRMQRGEKSMYSSEVIPQPHTTEHDDWAIEKV